MKEEMAKAIAQQTTPEYAAKVQHHYAQALANAAASPTVAKALPSHQSTVPVAAEDDLPYPKDSKVVVWLGEDNKYTGIVKDDRPKWLVLQTDNGKLRVCKDKIVRAEILDKIARHHD